MFCSFYTGYFLFPQLQLLLALEFQMVRGYLPGHGHVAEWSKALPC